jgi:hypothetical protein
VEAAAIARDVADRAGHGWRPASASNQGGDRGTPSAMTRCSTRSEAAPRRCRARNGPPPRWPR